MTVETQTETTFITNEIEYARTIRSRIEPLLALFVLVAAPPPHLLIRLRGNKIEAINQTHLHI